MNSRKNLQISCAACEEIIIAGSVQADPAAQEHLQQCKACREFADFQQTLLQAEPLIHNPIPTWESIKAEHARRRRQRSRILRFIALPAAAAAAAMVAIGGFYMQFAGNENPEIIPAAEYGFMADVDTLAAALEESSVALAWDNSRIGEKALNSVQAARSGGSQWQIELFDPYNIEEQ